MAEIPQALQDFINARCPRNELAPGESQMVDSTDINDCFMLLLNSMFELLPLVSLEPPASIDAEPGNNQITLTWSVVEHAAGYIVKRDGIPVYSGIFPTFLDDDVLNGVPHTYEVYATAPGYVTSLPASIMTEAGEEIPTLDAPAIVVTPGNGQLSVAVTPDTNATSTLVEASSNNFVTIAASQSGGSSPLVITGLTNGTAYKVRAKSSAAGYNDSATTVASGTYTPVAPTAPYTATVYHSATDPFVDTSTAPTTGVTLLRSVTPSAGDDIVVQLNDFPFEYFILEYDDTEADVTAFFDTVFHNEAIPGFEFRGPFAVGGKKYVTSFSPTAFDASPATVTFSK